MAARGVTNYQWNGGDALADLGLVHLGARLYDPVIGRFLSRDPLIIPRTASSTNPYAFAFNDPIDFTDPSGLSPYDPNGQSNSACASSSGGSCGGTGADSWQEAGAAWFAFGYQLFQVATGIGSAKTVAPQLLDPEQLTRSTSQFFGNLQSYGIGVLEGAWHVVTHPLEIAQGVVAGIKMAGEGWAKIYIAVAGTEEQNEYLRREGATIRTRVVQWALTTSEDDALRQIGQGMGKAATTAYAMQYAVSRFGDKVGANDPGGYTTFYHGGRTADVNAMAGNLLPVSVNTGVYPRGSFFTHAASDPNALYAASSWPVVRGVSSTNVSVLQVRVPNSVLSDLMGGSRPLVITNATPGFYPPFPMETVFLPEALPAINASAQFLVIPPMF